ncbi:MAG: hypothetical protein Q9227_009150 [Pyrenula ochraceoflavens]
MALGPVSEADHVRDKARKDLLNLLEGVRGKKNLVTNRALASTIGLFAKFSLLQEYGIDKVFLLENGNTDSSQHNIVYLLPGEKTAEIQATAAQIKSLQRGSLAQHEFFIFWTPRRTLVSNIILEEEGVLGDVNISEFPLYFLQLEQDLLSLELENAFIDLYLHKDPTPILLASKALMLIQKRHGFFPKILGKGDYARQLANLLLRQRKELDAEETSSSSLQGIMPSTSIESLIIIDRDVDLATPLMTQLTYEGLIEEFIGIQHNQAEVDTSVIGAAPGEQQQAQSSSTASPSPNARQGMKRKVQFDSSDTLFSQIRDTNFAIVGSLLNKVARRLQSDYQNRHQSQSINELRDFVNKLPSLKQEHSSLGIHTNLAKEISTQTDTEMFRRSLGIQQGFTQGDEPTDQHDSIEEMISRDVSLHTILRLLCLESTVSGGLRTRDLDLFRRLILHAYGYQHLLTLDTLEKMELLQPRSSVNASLLPLPGTSASSSASSTKTNYAYLRKALRLIVNEVDEQKPDDIAYVYSGYAPLSIRIIQCALQKQYLINLTQSRQAASSAGAVSAVTTTFHPFDEILKSVKGPTFSITQKAGDEKAAKARQALYGSGQGHGREKTVYIMFVGGVTFTEIAALRFIGKQMEERGERRKIVICTTGVISGNKIVNQTIEKADFTK